MIFTIAHKELKSMFSSPLAWVVLAFVQGVIAYVFIGSLNGFLIAQAQLARTPNAAGLTEIAIVPMFGVGQMLLLMSIPLLTMRLISEEKRNHEVNFRGKTQSDYGVFNFCAHINDADHSWKISCNGNFPFLDSLAHRMHGALGNCRRNN